MPKTKEKDSMTDKQEEQIQTSIQVPESWLKEIDGIAEDMSEPGQRVRRSVALRLALRRGIGVLKAEIRKR